MCCERIGPARRCGLAGSERSALTCFYSIRRCAETVASPCESDRRRIAWDECAQHARSPRSIRVVRSAYPVPGSAYCDAAQQWRVRRAARRRPRRPMAGGAARGGRDARRASVAAARQLRRSSASSARTGRGDDPRRLDWRLLARSDRAFVRLTDDRATLRTAMLVDALARRWRSRLPAAREVARGAGAGRRRSRRSRTRGRSGRAGDRARRRRSARAARAAQRDASR